MRCASVLMAVLLTVGSTAVAAQSQTDQQVTTVAIEVEKVAAPSAARRLRHSRGP